MACICLANITTGGFRFRRSGTLGFLKHIARSATGVVCGNAERCSAAGFLFGVFRLAGSDRPLVVRLGTRTAGGLRGRHRALALAVRCAAGTLQASLAAELQRRGGRFVNFRGLLLLLLLLLLWRVLLLLLRRWQRRRRRWLLLVMRRRLLLLLLLLLVTLVRRLPPRRWRGRRGVGSAVAAVHQDRHPALQLGTARLGGLRGRALLLELLLQRLHALRRRVTLLGHRGRRTLRALLGGGGGRDALLSVEATCVRLLVLLVRTEHSLLQLLLERRDGLPHIRQRQRWIHNDTPRWVRSLGRCKAVSLWDPASTGSAASRPPSLLLLADGDAAVVTVTRVINRDPSEAPEFELASLGRALSSQEGRLALSEFQDALAAVADVERTAPDE